MHLREVFPRLEFTARGELCEFDEPSSFADWMKSWYIPPSILPSQSGEISGNI